MEWSFVLSVGLGLSVAGLVYLIIRCLAAPSLADKLGHIRSSALIRAPATRDTFNRWIEEYERRLRRGGSTSIKGRHFAMILAAACLTSIIVGIYVFHNIVATAFFVVATVLLIDSYLVFKERSIQDHMLSQLASAVRVFAAAFAVTPQVEKGIAAVADSCPDPLGKVFREANKAFIARKPLDSVLIGMARDMNFEYGLIFVQLVRQVKSNTLILPLFQELITRITEKDMHVKKNRATISGERFMSLMMVAAPIPMYFLVRSIAPEAPEYLTQTFSGRIMVCIVFLSAITWAILSRITEKVEE